MPKLETVYLNNDNQLRVTVTDQDGAADTGATVSAITQEAGGANVETGLALIHSASGVYTVVLDESQYTAGQTYYAIATVTGSSGENGQVRIRFRVAHRDA